MKKSWSIFFLTPLFLLSCQQGETSHTPAKTIEQTENAENGIPLFSVMDSMNKYANVDSIMLEGSRLYTNLFIGRANDRQLAVQWIEKKNCIVFFQKQNEAWLATDTVDFYFEFCHIKFEDLNGDEINDAVVYSPAGSAGNLENVVFLFNPSTGSFQHNSDYDLPNVQYDRENKWIRSWWYGGATHCQTKEKYNMKGEHVVFDSGITYCPNDSTLGETGIIEYYKMNGEKKVITKTIPGKYDQLYKIFDSAFWNSKELYP
jgi:hypothetical protein